MPMIRSCRFCSVVYRSIFVRYTGIMVVFVLGSIEALILSENPAGSVILQQKSSSRYRDRNTMLFNMF